MPSEIGLKCKEGKFAGKEFRFPERTTCILGRSPECGVSLPDDNDHRYVSRHHCLLDINPPDIRIRDFGSLNGTYVNKKKIGQRPKGKGVEEAANYTYREVDLKDGDEVFIGASVFTVSVKTATFCSECGNELQESDALVTEDKSGRIFCDECSSRMRTIVGAAPFTEDIRRCAVCSSDLPPRPGTRRPGTMLCAACRKNPLQIIEHMQNQATSEQGPFAGIDDYKIIRKLGEGGMGAVYLAEHGPTSIRVAMKVMLPEVASQEVAITMFLRETENTKALNHPNVVRLFDSGYSRGAFFLSLEYCEGGSVAGLMHESGGTLSLDDAIPVVVQTLDALDYAHSAQLPYVMLEDGTEGTGTGLVHRDIKPLNIFLLNPGSTVEVKLGDYGLAKAFDMAGLSGQTWTGTTAGSPLFMPRQQVINFKYSKPEVDVWATAATFYNMVTGQHPRTFDKTRDPWQVILQTNPTPIREHLPSLPAKLAEVIDHALTDDPEIPFKSACQLRDAFVGAI